MDILTLTLHDIYSLEPLFLVSKILDQVGRRSAARWGHGNRSEIDMDHRKGVGRSQYSAAARERVSKRVLRDGVHTGSGKA